MKKLSIRLRLTLFTVVLLSLLCLLFTLLVQHQMRRSLVEPMRLISVQELEPDAAAPLASEPAQPLVPAAVTTLAQGERAFTLGLWLTMGGMVILGAALTYLISARALKPLKDLAKAMDAVDENTLSCDFDAFRSGDEVARLADSFDGLLRRLRAAFERERRFGAYAAHELKTPLAVVKTALDVMDPEDYHDPAICRETLRTIGQQNERMISLSAQLLQFSRLQAAGHVQPVEVSALAQEILRELSPLAARHQVRLHGHLSPWTAEADEVMLRQALSNLVENAIRYNRPGGRVDISLEGGTLIVADTGIGIPPEDAGHIFEAFYRVDKSRSRSMGGTGLGLAIARETLVQCGATLRYEPNQPQGSRFIVTFPEKR